MTNDRYDRQRRLVEVGAEGQARIQAHAARIVAGPGAGVALAYLVRAGVERASLARGAHPGFPHRAAFEFATPLAVADGAHQALRELRRALDAQGARS